MDDIAEFLSAPDKFGPAKVARYHAKLSAGARREAHAAFMRDDAEVRDCWQRDSGRGWVGRGGSS